MIYDEHENLLGCPKCGSVWVGYQCWLKRYACLICGWKMERECEIGDYGNLVPIPDSEKKDKI